MGRKRLAGVCAAGVCALFAALTAGCSSSARLVRWDEHGGVVAIPSNSNYWPTYHRDRAQALMQKKCPAGYLVEKEEEVVVGQTAHTHSNTDTQAPPALVFGGEETVEGRRGKTRSGAGVAVPLGQGRATTEETTTYQNVTEYRIWFRPTGP